MTNALTWPFFVEGPGGASLHARAFAMNQATLEKLKASPEVQQLKAAIPSDNVLANMSIFVDNTLPDDDIRTGTYQAIRDFVLFGGKP